MHILAQDSFDFHISGARQRLKLSCTSDVLRRLFSRGGGPFHQLTNYCYKTKMPQNMPQNRMPQNEMALNKMRQNANSLAACLTFDQLTCEFEKSVPLA